MPLRNVRLHPLKKTSPFRRIAIGTWDGPGDPQIYGSMDVDLTTVDAWLASRASDAPRVTVTHLMTRAVGRAMREFPDLNGILRFHKVFLRESVDVTCLASFADDQGKMDLASVRITDADQKNAEEIAVQMDEKLARLRGAKDTDVQKTSRMMSMLPGFVVRFLLWITALLTYTFNLRVPGIPPDLFGGCIITNVGMMGFDVAYAPLVPYSRVPLLLLLGATKLRPVVIDGEVVARNTLPINATVDHRFCDGALLGKMAKSIRWSFENPEEAFG